MNKKDVYEALISDLKAVLAGEDNSISAMSTVACLVHERLDHAYWSGFYIDDGKQLKVGPYQGTMGCLSIAYDRGVCGRAYRERRTQIVDDVHADPEHIACDAKSNSEIVIPVRRKDGSVYAVFDVDSEQLGAFDDTDRNYLEAIVATCVEATLN